MALIVPNPTVPTDGQPLEATTLLQNLQAVYAAIQAFDGSQIVAGSVGVNALTSSINPNTLLHDTITPFVQSGCGWAVVSGLQATMAGGIIYVATSLAEYRVVVNGVASYTAGASTDTYVDIDYNGNVYYQAVSNGSAAPSLTANSIRIAKLISNGTGITSIQQTGTDSLGNIICNRSPRPVTLSSVSSSTTQGSIAATVVLLTNLTTAVIVPNSSQTIRIEVLLPSIVSNAIATARLYIFNSATVTGTAIQEQLILLPIANAPSGGFVFFEGTFPAGIQNFCAAVNLDTGVGNTTLSTAQLAYLTVKLV
jgi:hypothetical protein